MVTQSVASASAASTALVPAMQQLTVQESSTWAGFKVVLQTSIREGIRSLPIEIVDLVAAYTPKTELAKAWYRRFCATASTFSDNRALIQEVVKDTGVLLLSSSAYTRDAFTQARAVTAIPAVSTLCFEDVENPQDRANQQDRFSSCMSGIANSISTFASGIEHIEIAASLSGPQLMQDLLREFNNLRSMRIIYKQGCTIGIGGIFKDTFYPFPEKVTRFELVGCPSPQNDVLKAVCATIRKDQVITEIEITPSEESAATDYTFHMGHYFSKTAKSLILNPALFHSVASPLPFAYDPDLQMVGALKQKGRIECFQLPLDAMAQLSSLVIESADTATWLTDDLKKAYDNWIMGALFKASKVTTVRANWQMITPRFWDYFRQPELVIEGEGGASSLPLLDPAREYDFRLKINFSVAEESALVSWFGTGLEILERPQGAQGMYHLRYKRSI